MDEKIVATLNKWLSHGIITKSQFDKIHEFEGNPQQKSTANIHEHYASYHKFLEDERKTYHLKDIYDEHRRTFKNE